LKADEKCKHCKYVATHVISLAKNKREQVCVHCAARMVKTKKYTELLIQKMV